MERQHDGKFHHIGRRRRLIEYIPAGRVYRQDKRASGGKGARPFDPPDCLRLDGRLLR